MVLINRACSLAEAMRKVAASRSANTRSALDAMIDAIGDLGLFLSELQLWKARCECDAKLCMRAQRIYRRTGVSSCRPIVARGPASDEIVVGMQPCRFGPRPCTRVQVHMINETLAVGR